MAMRRDVLAAIQHKFWPRIDSKGVLVKPDQADSGYSEELRKLSRDPGVVWCGPFITGLVYLGVFRDRHQAKAFWFEMRDKGYDKFRFDYERAVKLGKDTWPYTGSKYEDALLLRSISGSGLDNAVEPGSLLNSPKLISVSDSIWRSHRKMELDPVIQIDTDFGLHVLRRGDRIRKKSQAMNQKTPVTEIFILRPVAEGPSRVPVVDKERANVL